MPVLEEPAAGRHRLDDLVLRQDRADRLVAAAQALGDRHQVGDDALLLAGVERAGAAHAAHHLVEDQQHAVSVAHLAHRLEVARHRHQHAGRRAADRLGDERDHGLGPERLQRGLEFGGQAQAVGFGGLVGELLAVRVARREVGRRHQQRRERGAPPFVATDRERAQRVAVIALAPGDEMGAPRLPDLDEVLARHLQRRFDRLRAAANQIGMAHAGRRRGDQLIRQRLRHLGGEETGVGVGQAIDLRVHRRDHVGMAVAQRGDRRAAGGVEVLAAGGIADQHAGRRDGDGRQLAQLAMEDVGHGDNRYGTNVLIPM